MLNQYIELIIGKRVNILECPALEKNTLGVGLFGEFRQLETSKLWNGRVCTFIRSLYLTTDQQKVSQFATKFFTSVIDQIYDVAACNKKIRTYQKWMETTFDTVAAKPLGQTKRILNFYMEINQIFKKFDDTKTYQLSTNNVDTTDTKEKIFNYIYSNAAQLIDCPWLKFVTPAYTLFFEPETHDIIEVDSGDKDKTERAQKVLEFKKGLPNETTTYEIGYTKSYSIRSRDKDGNVTEVSFSNESCKYEGSKNALAEFLINNITTFPQCSITLTWPETEDIYTLQGTIK